MANSSIANRPPAGHQVAGDPRAPGDKETPGGPVGFPFQDGHSPGFSLG